MIIKNNDIRLKFVRSKYGYGIRSLYLSLFILFFILIITNTSVAVIDCSICHKTDPGKSVLKAKDTIEISNQTCLKCHSPNYPPTPMGYNTHLAHVGKYSAKVDYFSRHPGVGSGVNCDNCHMNIGQNCQNCHVKNIPHIQPPLGYNCKECHGELDKLFRHPTINLKIHDIFGLGNTTACTMCHNPDNMASLKLASGDIVSIQEPHKLCYQCHSNYYNLWNSGKHYVNKTIPTIDSAKAMYGDEVDITDMPGIIADFEEKWGRDNTCVNCHNPHNPSELYQLPIIGSDKTTGVSIIGSNILYIIPLILIIPFIIMIVVNRKELNIKSRIKDINLFIKSGIKGVNLSNIKTRFKLPKISIPISISVEKEDGTDGARNIDSIGKLEENQGLHTIDSQKIDIKDQKIGKKKFSERHKKDIYFASIIFIIFLSFYVVFGTFTPMISVASESMSPNIEKGDLVFYSDISKVDNIMTFSSNKEYMSFGNYGDVIMYRPFGQKDITPYIHRAIYYVNAGDEMWAGGPISSYGGYITKGDNTLTNSQYDQQLDISKDTPIKKEWIIGVARFRIPYIGYLRLIL